MTFTENLKLREAVFRKMGWDFVQEKGSLFCSGKFKWINPNHKRIFNINKLPPTETTWEVCAEYLTGFLQGLDCYYRIEDGEHEGIDSKAFIIRNYNNGNYVAGAEIINDNIARAACEAFMEVALA